MKVRLPKQPSQAEMLQQFQKMQDDMQTRQAELNETEFTASAGGGVVKATVYGSKTVKSIEIAKEAVDPDDVEMLSDLICAAVNEALSIADKTVEEEMQKITGNMNLPNIF